MNSLDKVVADNEALTKKVITLEIERDRQLKEIQRLIAERDIALCEYANLREQIWFTKIGESFRGQDFGFHINIEMLTRLKDEQRVIFIKQEIYNAYQRIIRRATAQDVVYEMLFKSPKF